MSQREITTPMTRRNLLTLAGQSLIAAGVANALPRAAGAVQQAAPPKVELPPLSAPTEQKESGPPNPQSPDQRVGYAVVGLGHLALDEVLPAFVQCKRSKVTALVSGHPEKAAAVARQYGIDPRNIYNYQNYDELRNNPAVQVVYVILPNSMHAEYTIRAAKAGKHILCEKPMATSARDCQQMIDASKSAGRKLMIGYRMQYEPYNREIIRRVRAKELGDLKLFTADNCQNQGDPTQWRLKKAMSGGGSLPDVGIYCLNAARYISGEEPIEVFARAWSTPGDPRFQEVEESMVFELRFPSGLLASCTCGYGNHRLQRYTVAGAQGWAELNPAFPYRGQHLRVSRADGKREEMTEVKLDQPNQFALEIDHMSMCVMENQTPHTPGEEGLADLRIIEQLYASAQAGHAITLPPSPGSTRGPDPQQEG